MAFSTFLFWFVVGISISTSFHILKDKFGKYIPHIINIVAFIIVVMATKFIYPPVYDGVLTSIPFWLGLLGGSIPGFILAEIILGEDLTPQYQHSD